LKVSSVPSGYEKSPDYGSPEPSGFEMVLWAILLVAVIVLLWRINGGTL
jgi:hypothetical protein